MVRANNPAEKSSQSTEHRKLYRSPELVEYGDIQDITHGDSGTTFDAPGTRKETL